MSTTVRSKWIISPFWDTVFFVGTPLICLACILPLKGMWASRDIWLVIMGVSSFGHHLPGFIRAYGDKQLFARFKWRFILAPPLIFAVFLVFSFQNLHGMLLMLMLWSVWHVMMQHYGFMRIYDAKSGSFSPWTSRLDWIMCASWFVAIVFWSQPYLHNFFEQAYHTGMPLVNTMAFAWLRSAVTTLTFTVTGVYLVYNLVAIRRGEPISYVKLLLMVMTTGFLYVVWVAIDDIYLGLATWEVFHDVQYFAIVWVFNRNVVDKGGQVRGFVKALFRPRGSMILLYAALIFGYGAIGYSVQTFTKDTLHTVLASVVLTSTLLHYYYDGFIWKMRQSDTRSGLDLDQTNSAERLGFWARVRMKIDGNLASARAAAMQWAYFAVPIGLLYGMEVYGSRPEELAMRESIAQTVPGAMPAFQGLGAAYEDYGRIDDAIATFEVAIERRPEDYNAYNRLGLALLKRDGTPAMGEAEALFKKAAEVKPDWPEPWCNLGTLALRRSQFERREEHLAAAIGYYEKAVELGTQEPDVYMNLGSAYAMSGRSDDAVSALEHAVELRPEHAPTHANLARALLASGERDEAKRHYDRAVQLDTNAPASFSSGEFDE